MAEVAIDRRTLLRAVACGVGAVSFGRLLVACLDTASSDLIGDRVRPTATNTPIPTDQDEHVPGTSPPVDGGDQAMTFPVESWEARVKQLESDQQRIYERGAFSRGDAGQWTGKENSHEPKASIVTAAKGQQRIEVTVEHVMGNSKMDAGTSVDAGNDASTEADASDSGADADAASPSGGVPPLTVHYITTIYIRGMVKGVDTVVGLWEFASTDPAPPTVQFAIPEGVASVIAYEWCTLHGLWKAPPLNIV